MEREVDGMRTLVILLVGGLMAQGCGDDEGGGGPTFATELCSAGETRCIGNATAECAESGLQWNLNNCGDGHYCDANGTKCTPRECQFPGQSKCQDNVTAAHCNENGSALTEEKCDGAECVAGACLSSVCTDGETWCGFRQAARCVGGSWEKAECEQGDVCLDGECIAAVCDSQVVECVDDKTSRACNVERNGWTETACGAGEKCYPSYGICLPALETDPPPPGEDVTEPEDVIEDVEEELPEPVDTGPPAELEPLDKATVVVDGESIVFTSHKSASYVETDSDLRITMDKGQFKIEISISPIEEFDVGQYSSAAQSDTNVVIWYHDGSDLVGQAQFRYVSVDFELELLKFQSPGGRVKGTFSGTFTDDGGATTIPFTDGEFDVKRHD